MKLNELEFKDFFMHILNGVAVGSIIVLIPSAFLSEILKIFIPILPALETVLNFATASNAVMGFSVGVAIGHRFEFSPISFLSLGVATQIAGGAILFEDSAMVLSGTGDILSMMFTATLGSLLIFWLEERVGSFAILIIPTVIVGLIGWIGYAVLPYWLMITTAVGNVIEVFTTAQPIIMAMLIAISFAFLITSPITSVGIALAISISGIGSAAANLGASAAGIGYGLYGLSVNKRGIVWATIIGSPKIALPVLIKRPKTFLPIAATAAVLGFFAAILNLQGTPMSAGFGLSGLIGPLNHITSSPGGWNITNVLVAFVMWIVLPVILTIIFKWLFFDWLGIVKAEDYAVDI